MRPTSTRDVLGHVDSHYRTIAREGGRAVLGKSSGGFGSLHLVMEYPGVFAAFASHSGDSYFRYAQPPCVSRRATHAREASYSISSRSSRRSRRSTSARRSDYVTMEMLGYSAAYSPRSAKAFDIDLPFDLHTGELRDEIFEKWLSFDPVERVPHRGRGTERPALALHRLRPSRRIRPGHRCPSGDAADARTRA